MIKVKRISLSGFRGILKPQGLFLTNKGSSTPRSLVLYGLNSSGKTSFVDGLEWFMSKENRIEWLQRQDAREKAYPHQAVNQKKDSSFVELEFSGLGTSNGILRKTYNHKKITQPTLSSDDDFEAVQKAFVIKPYLRYLEVIDFVYNCTGPEKYQKLASWMGFKDELNFQRKLSLDILPGLRSKQETNESRIKLLEEQLMQLMGSQSLDEIELLQIGNEILKNNKQTPCKTIKELLDYIPEFAKLRTVLSASVLFGKLTQARIDINSFEPNSDIQNSLSDITGKITQFKSERDKVNQIDIIGLYDQALELLTNKEEEDTECPICGTRWDRKKLVEHVKQELKLLTKVRDDKEAIEKEIKNIKQLISIEIEKVKKVLIVCEEVDKNVKKISWDNIKAYHDVLSNLKDICCSDPLLRDKSTFVMSADLIQEATHERDGILEKISNHIAKVQPSNEDIRLIEDIDKLTQMKEKWGELNNAREEYSFINEQIKIFTVVGKELIDRIQNDIKSRFEKISERISKYFSILRDDKDIKNIVIKLNEDKGRAVGRSAEIQLDYYNVVVKPAYKVLSESLLNSLGLAVYFACIKQFNKKCKFIILDDIMNSLDIDKRDTLLDLIEKEFKDYQVILFTHDYYWFQKIIRKFPSWIPKKIKDWKYKTGAIIDAATTTQEEIEEHLSDATRSETAGWVLGRHVESILNEICEHLWAEVRYRYTKNDPPSMEELFIALYKRIKSKAKDHPILNQILEAKKFEPLLRNFVDHAQTKSCSSIRPKEISRASEEWFKLEEQLWCDQCNQFIVYDKTKDSIECRCANKRITRLDTPGSN